MAVSQSKRSIHRAQPLRPTSIGEVFHFPQAQGKLLKDVEFSSASGYHNISLNFEDETCLNFVIDIGFTLGTDYSDWKTGNQRVLHRWPPIRNY